MDSDEKMQPFPSDPLLKYHVEFHPGFTFGAAVGYQCKCVSIELDYSYSYNELCQAKSPSTQDQSPNALQGFTQSHSLLAQGLFLIPLIAI